MTDLIQNIAIFCLVVLSAWLLGGVFYQARKLNDLEHILELIGGRVTTYKAGPYAGNPTQRVDDNGIVHKHNDIKSGGKF